MEVEGLREGGLPVPQPFSFAAQPWADYGFALEEGQGHLGLARRLILWVNLKQQRNH